VGRRKKKSEFEEWFDAQFGPLCVGGFWDKKTDLELSGMMRLGAFARDEYHVRAIRLARKDAALKAWCAVNAKPELPNRPTGGGPRGGLPTQPRGPGNRS